MADMSATTGPVVVSVVDIDSAVTDLRSSFDRCARFFHHHEPSKPNGKEYQKLVLELDLLYLRLVRWEQCVETAVNSSSERTESDTAPNGLGANKANRARVPRGTIQTNQFRRSISTGNDSPPSEVRGHVIGSLLRANGPIQLLQVIEVKLERAASTIRLLNLENRKPTKVAFEYEDSESDNDDDNSDEDDENEDENEENEDQITAELSIRVKLLADLSRPRRRSESQILKIKWAVRSERRFKHLIEDLNTLTSDLIELIPTMKPMQQALTVQQATELVQPSNFEHLGNAPAILEEASQEVDPMLKTALANIAQRLSGTPLFRYLDTAESTQNFGSDVDVIKASRSASSLGHRYDYMYASSRARAHFGNSYDGRYILDD